MNIPNLLTGIRFVLIPVFIGVFFSGHPNSLVVSFAVFVLAGITDVLDGYIARRYDLITKFGIVMDPLADKLMLLTVLACYTVADLIPLWILGIMVVKELLMIVGGLFLYYFREQHVVPSTKYGKLATAFFYIAIVVIVFLPIKPLALVVLSIAVILKLVAFAHYAAGFRKIHIEK